mgnify:CR=1 FL=1
MNQTEYQILVELSQQEVDENAKTLECVLTTGETFKENSLNGAFVSEHLDYLCGINDVLKLIAKMYELKPQSVTQAVRLNRETFAAEFHYSKR